MWSQCRGKTETKSWRFLKNIAGAIKSRWWFSHPCKPSHNISLRTVSSHSNRLVCSSGFFLWCNLPLASMRKWIEILPLKQFSLVMEFMTLPLKWAESHAWINTAVNMNGKSISFYVAVYVVTMWITFSIKTYISLIGKMSWVWGANNTLENSGEGHRPLSLPEPNNWSCFSIELFWWGVINLIFPPQLLNLGDSMSGGEGRLYESLSPSRY